MKQLHFGYEDLLGSTLDRIDRWLVTANPGDWACYHRSSSLERHGAETGTRLWYAHNHNLVTLAQFRVGDGDFMYLACRTAPKTKPKPRWEG